MQIPDVRTGNDVIDAVVVDSESVGADGQGSGAKILYGKGALDRYLSRCKLKDSEVCSTFLGSKFDCTIRFSRKWCDV